MATGTSDLTAVLASITPERAAFVEPSMPVTEMQHILVFHSDATAGSDGSGTIVNLLSKAAWLTSIGTVTLCLLGAMLIAFVYGQEPGSWAISYFGALI